MFIVKYFDIETESHGEVYYDYDKACNRKRILKQKYGVKDITIEEIGTWDKSTSIAIRWGIEDVKLRAEETKGLKLTDQQCLKVLKGIHKTHDADIGINWTTIDCGIENFLDD